MTDIVERLRQDEKFSNQSREPKSKRLLIQERREAAGEIISLKAERDRLKEACEMILKRVGESGGLLIEPGDGPAMVLANAIAKAKQESAGGILTPSENALIEALESLIPSNLNLECNLPDSATVPVNVAMGDLRRARAALSQNPRQQASTANPVAELPTPTPVDAGDGDTGDVL